MCLGNLYCLALAAVLSAISSVLSNEYGCNSSQFDQLHRVAFPSEKCATGGTKMVKLLPDKTYLQESGGFWHGGEDTCFPNESVLSKVKTLTAKMLQLFECSLFMCNLYRLPNIRSFVVEMEHTCS